MTKKLICILLIVIPVLVQAGPAEILKTLPFTYCEENSAGAYRQDVTFTTLEQASQKHSCNLTHPSTDGCILSEAELQIMRLTTKADRKLGKSIIMANSESDASWICGIACCVLIIIIVM
jgi:hypothetical protein